MKKFYRVMVSYVIEVDAENDGDAVRAVQFKSIYGESTVAGLSVKVIGSEFRVQVEPEPEAAVEAVTPAPVPVENDDIPF